MSKQVAFFESEEASQQWAKSRGIVAKSIPLGNVWILMGSQERRRRTVRPDSISKNLRKNLTRKSITIF